MNGASVNGERFQEEPKIPPKETYPESRIDVFGIVNEVQRGQIQDIFRKNILYRMKTEIQCDTI